MRVALLNVRCTGYWPFQPGLTEEERRMEGGHNDRRGHPLVTVEMHIANPSAFPYVSLSGDDAIFPYGQRMTIPWVDGQTIEGRVVDTGSHFRGSGKVYRQPGYEPIDVCVESSSSRVPKLVTATIYEGDILGGGRAAADVRGTVDLTALKGQHVEWGSSESDAPLPEEDTGGGDFGPLAVGAGAVAANGCDPSDASALLIMLVMVAVMVAIHRWEP